MTKHILISVMTLFLTISSFAGNINPVGIYVSTKGETLKASFGIRDNTVLVVLPDKRKLKLYGAISASGARYINGNMEFWEHQDVVKYSIDGKIVFIGKKSSKCHFKPTWFILALVA